MVKKILNHKLAKNQQVRFVLSAGTGFLVNVLVFFLLSNTIFVKPVYRIFTHNIHNSTVAFAISFFAGVVVNFLLTRYYVFYESKSTPPKQFIRFVSVAIIGFFANLGLVTLLTQKFDVYPTVAVVIAGLSLFFASYFIHKVFSFSLSLKDAT
jgi:putative flippase GtrA